MNEHKIIEKINMHKTIVMEPKEAKLLRNAMNIFKTNVVGRGAVLLAVCKGKIAEGIDFADEMARCVVLVGIPYPSLADKRV